MNIKHFTSLSKCHPVTIIVLCLVLFSFAQVIYAEPEPGSDSNSIDSNQVEAALSFFCSDQAVRYQLIEGSAIMDDCLMCARPSVMIPVRGSFWLVPTKRDMWFSYFSVRNFRFSSIPSQVNLKYNGLMEGNYEIGGDFALVHQMRLKGHINNFRDLKFDSGVVLPKVGFPWIEIDLRQVPPTDPMHTFSMHLVAVPWPMITFSTEAGFHSSNTTNDKYLYVSNGDLLSSTGRIVRRNNQLTGRLGIMPIVPDIGLDAFMRGKSPSISTADFCRSEIWFSAERNIFSETLGYLHEGDLLSSSGRIVRRFKEFIAPFSPQPPIADYGLDAIAHGKDGLLMFSTEKSFFSEKLGKTIGDGDLLREGGQVFRTNTQLMARFRPINSTVKDFGLDAVYVWPHGEIWFSTETDFIDARFGHVGNGDLLSDRGRIIARNRDLLKQFAPLEDLADFGLDGASILWPPIKGDFDGDGDVDMDDYALFSRAWSTRPEYSPWNINFDISDYADDSVDILDLSILANNWLLCSE